MHTGRLKYRITLQKPGIPTANAVGEPTATWENLTTKWAAVEPLQGREFWAAQQVQAEKTYRVTIRYMPGLDETMRVLYAGRVLSIRAIIDPEERHEWLELMCTEGVENG